ncbi:MAG: post-transcriptional regulator [Erysipelotrichaceae bacterium]|jgi:DNA-directed RNA polymerase subunit F|nr:post-transcriptional regulator [Bacillota bacterium]HCY07213.1 hypothetical protein [Erysipelotrichaceae bacterium]
MEIYIQMAIVMKLYNLRRTSNPNFTYEQLEDILYNEIWKDSKPDSLHSIVDDIMSVNGDELIQYISKQAIVKQHHIEDFTDLLGG